MAYNTNSQLYLKFGTEKAIPTKWGDYVNFGSNRVIEGLLDLTTLTSTATVQGDVLFFPALAAGQLYIEQVDLITETAAASGTSFSVGLIQTDRTTIPSNYSTAFVNAIVTASVDTAGKKVSLTNGVTSAGGLIGSAAASATGPYYITALSSGTFTTGKIRVRISYHAIGVITQ